ncbi:uncharacterized protein [Coffea arabica]|uniref:Retrotransposon gag domain-containing protein n=1 Tax=Coffea arabica TaxID=13443 RepID=A0A6P6SNZ1_COFAR
MTTKPQSSDKTMATTQSETTSPGIQLAELLTKFEEMASTMTAQKKLIDELVGSGVQPELASTKQMEFEPFIIPTMQTTFSMQGPPEGTFTYPTIHLPYTYPPNPAFLPTQMQGPQPQVTANIPHEPHTFYYPTTEPYLPDHVIQTKPEVGGSSAPVDMKLLKRLDRFEEFIRKSQGVSEQGGLDYSELCLFPDMQLPVGFKAPKFSKYDGNGNPKTHIRMFANKLGKPIDDENLPVRLFPESLEGDALDWYSNLKPEDMKSWMDLSTAFMRQYEYNCELAPTRSTLEGTKRKPSEDHKTYAKRWRKLAAKVEPPMTENEIIRTFIKAHDPPYFEEIFRMTGCSFAEMVNKLEEFDEFVKAGKIVNVSTLKMQLEALQGQNNSEKKSQFKGKERETAFVGKQSPSARPRFSNHPTYSSTYPYYPNSRPIHHPRPRPNYPNTSTIPYHTSPPNFPTRPHPPYHPRSTLPVNPTYHYHQTSDTQNPTPYRTFTNLGRPVDQLYEQLKAVGKIGVIPPKIYFNRFPSDYDPQAVCAYHSGAPGHSTNNCRALKHKVQDMIEVGEIVLREKDIQGSSVSTNPFPKHKDAFETSTPHEEI